MATRRKASSESAPAAPAPAPAKKAAAVNIKPATLVKVSGGKASGQTFDNYGEAKAAYDALLDAAIAGNPDPADEVMIHDKHGQRKRFRPASIARQQAARKV